MSVINVELETQRFMFMPGETVSGQVSWTLGEASTTIEISLVWFTSGKGQIDEGRPYTQRIESPLPQGCAPFSFILPPGPYSFTGSLITLAWAVEAKLLPQKTIARRPIVVAPGREEIRMR